MESNLEKLTKQLDSGVDMLNGKTAELFSSYNEAIKLLLVLHNQNLTTIIELRERIDKLEKQRRPWFLRILGL